MGAFQEWAQRGARPVLLPGPSGSSGGGTVGNWWRGGAAGVPQERALVPAGQVTRTQRWQEGTPPPNIGNPTWPAAIFQTAMIGVATKRFGGTEDEPGLSIPDRLQYRVPIRAAEAILRLHNIETEIEIPETHLIEKEVDKNIARYQRALSDRDGYLLQEDGVLKMIDTEARQSMTDLMASGGSRHEPTEQELTMARNLAPQLVNNHGGEMWRRVLGQAMLQAQDVAARDIKADFSPDMRRSLDELKKLGERNPDTYFACDGLTLWMTMDAEIREKLKGLIWGLTPSYLMIRRADPQQPDVIPIPLNRISGPVPQSSRFIASEFKMWPTFPRHVDKVGSVLFGALRERVQNLPRTGGTIQFQNLGRWGAVATIAVREPEKAVNAIGRLTKVAYDASRLQSYATETLSQDEGPTPQLVNPYRVYMEMLRVATGFDGPVRKSVLDSEFESIEQRLRTIQAAEMNLQHDLAEERLLSRMRDPNGSGRAGELCTPETARASLQIHADRAKRIMQRLAPEKEFLRQTLRMLDQAGVGDNPHRTRRFPITETQNTP